MLDKAKVTEKIKNLCKEYKIEEPDFNNYESVKKVCDRINNTCPFCHRYPHSRGAICQCEISGPDEFWK